MPIAMTPDGKITLLQMDGHLSSDEFKEGLEMQKRAVLRLPSSREPHFLKNIHLI